MAVKVTTWTADTNILTGTGTISVKIPGTFVTADPTNAAFVGVQLTRMGIWLEGRAVGDKISSLVVKDTDGVFYPAGTVLTALHDVLVSSTNQGISLPIGGPLAVEFPKTNRSKIAAGLYLVFTFQKSAVGVDTAVVNLAWDDLT